MKMYDDIIVGDVNWKEKYKELEQELKEKHVQITGLISTLNDLSEDNKGLARLIDRMKEKKIITDEQINEICAELNKEEGVKIFV